MHRHQIGKEQTSYSLSSTYPGSCSSGSFVHRERTCHRDESDLRKPNSDSTAGNPSRANRQQNPKNIQVLKGLPSRN
jgi:hypothetical protein